MYFLAKKKGNRFCDPFALDEPVVVESSSENQDHDSEDSNRESAEGNDYPDEELMHHSDGHSIDSNQPRRRKFTFFL